MGRNICALTSVAGHLIDSDIFLRIGEYHDLLIALQAHWDHQ